MGNKFDFAEEQVIPAQLYIMDKYEVAKAELAPLKKDADALFKVVLNGQFAVNIFKKIINMYCMYGKDVYIECEDDRMIFRISSNDIQGCYTIIKREMFQEYKPNKEGIAIDGKTLNKIMSKIKPELNPCFTMILKESNEVSIYVEEKGKLKEYSLPLIDTKYREEKIAKEYIDKLLAFKQNRIEIGVADLSELLDDAQLVGNTLHLFFENDILFFSTIDLNKMSKIAVSKAIADILQVDDVPENSAMVNLFYVKEQVEALKDVSERIELRFSMQYPLMIICKNEYFEHTYLLANLVRTD